MTDTDAAETIHAEVILRPAQAAAWEPVSAGTVHELEAPSGAVEIVTRALRTLGFELTASSPLTLSISGSRDLFRRVFQAEVGGGMPEVLVVPAEMAPYVEGVYIQTPPIYLD